LLPGARACVVVVTSRSRMSGLVAREGAVRVSLDLLPEPEALALLRRIIGPMRVDAEPVAAASLARYCAYLPLALRIAAERVAARPRATLAALAGELVGERHRLDVLTADDDESTAVRGVFSWSYHALPPDAAAMFRLVGLNAGPDISTPCAAALTGNTVTKARRLLELLASVHLLEETAHDRYQFHDLLRAYAAERAETEEPRRKRETAVHRLLIWYLHTAVAADRVLFPERIRPSVGAPRPSLKTLAFSTHAEALEWCETERVSMVAATRQALEFGENAVAWQLPIILWGFFTLRKHRSDWITTHRIGLTAAERSRDQVGQAWIVNSLGEAYCDLGRFDEAIECFGRSLALHRETGQRWGEGLALASLGLAYFGLERFEEAADHHQRGLAIFREIGNRWLEALSLNNLGNAYRNLQRFEEAAEYHLRALAIFRELGNRWGEGRSLSNLASAYRGMGRLGEAIEYYDTALTVRRDIGDRHGEAETLHNLGETQHDAGQLDAAREAWNAALAIFDEIGDSQATKVRGLLERA
jgi:tetratricopeptide (TPR) repeat protein